MVFYRSIIIMYMKNKKRVYLFISIFSFAVVLVSLVAICVLLITFKQARDDYSWLASQARAGAEERIVNPFWKHKESIDPEVPDPVDIPIDFDFLLGENQDIMGWIQVEGTPIDYPILYDTTFNNYYLSRNYKGANIGGGSIFVLGDNARDFTDFNTVVYGHNLLDGSMFAKLHQFRKKDFFDSHGQILIYTPDRKLTYQVFAAYRRDRQNIIANNDFSTEELRTEYLESIYENTALANFKPEYEVTASDRIITLSTCIGNPAYRYVVQGVLISDEPGIYSGSQSTDEA